MTGPRVCPYCSAGITASSASGNLYRCTDCGLPYHRRIVADDLTWALFASAAEDVTRRLRAVITDPDVRRVSAAIIFTDIIRRTLK